MEVNEEQTGHKDKKGQETKECVCVGGGSGRKQLAGDAGMNGSEFRQRSRAGSVVCTASSRERAAKIGTRVARRVDAS